MTRELFSPKSLAVGVFFFVGCASLGITRKDVVNAVFSTADILCIIAHAQNTDSRAIAEACALARDLEPAIRQVVAEHRVAVDREASARAAACRKDGGP